MTELKSINVAAMADACGDILVGAHGDAAAFATRVASLDRLAPQTMAFVRSADADLSALLAKLGRGILIVASPLTNGLPVIGEGCAVIETKNPRLAFARCVAACFAPPTLPVGIHPTAIIDPSAVIEAGAAIGAHVHIGRNCTIGAGTRIFANAVLLDEIRVGRNVTIYSGTVIGADGFGYEQNEAGEFEKFPHLGGVVIEDDVEIGANSCVDRGALDDTIIKRGARVDNLVHVAHNVVIGEDAMVIALTMVGGSVKIGARAWIAPSATIINQKSIGDDAVVGLSAVVTKDVAAGQTVMGSPAIDQAQFKAMNTAMKKLVQ